MNVRWNLVAQTRSPFLVLEFTQGKHDEAPFCVVSYHVTKGVTQWLRVRGNGRLNGNLPNLQLRLSVTLRFNVSCRTNHRVYYWCMTRDIRSDPFCDPCLRNLAKIRKLSSSVQLGLAHAMTQKGRKLLFTFERENHIPQLRKLWPETNLLT